MESTPIIQRSKRSAFRKYGPDYAVLILAGGVAVFFYFLSPFPKHLFIVKNNIGAIREDEALPVLPDLIPTWLSAVISFGTGIVVFALAQIWVRSGKDFHRAMLGLLTALVAGSWFQVICKILIGGLRPNFLSVCVPDITKAVGQGYGGMFYDKSVCTGPEKDVGDALESFPSGHANCAFAGLLFISLYLNAKIKLFGPEYPHTWKLFVVFTPILAATVLSLSRMLDYTHHWYDILAGSLIGIAFAFAAYRMQYRSIFNPENNHILLPRRMAELQYAQTNYPTTYPQKSSAQSYKNFQTAYPPLYQQGGAYV
eukprot:Phypoly_transcript_07662.p1 GENE.Phypoly_transcript_07662~~Phypoly_transcript_07662.p1  ORF type:complete len:312 (+),score=16.63 Phypoly_transcript_07662:592-1527(+)